MRQIDQAKQGVRERVWALLDQAGAVPPPGAYGKIPNVTGADAAATRLADLPVWQTAAVLKANPDKAQLPVRVRALSDGKLLYMAVPKIATLEPFYLLDPAELPAAPAQIASTAGAAAFAQRVGIDQMRPVDLLVCGSVAVNRSGARLGKGAGYSDIETALLIDAGLVAARTTIVTTVHDLQVIDEPIPESDHDFRVDLIVTPTQVIACGPPRRPPGLIWEHLTPEKVAAIPVLAARARPH